MSHGINAGEGAAVARIWARRLLVIAVLILVAIVGGILYAVGKTP